MTNFHISINMQLFIYDRQIVPPHGYYCLPPASHEKLVRFLLFSVNEPIDGMANIHSPLTNLCNQYRIIAVQL